jgi:Bacteriophage head to tail connecting protein
MLDRGGSQPIPLATGRFETSPFISFRWLKGAAEIYGRSPVMTVLPDIKTVNKVVELVLKNASISVTGIWQADDDGVLNPANIQLVPGSIIPKAVGSAGLTPLQAPGRFDVSSLMLDDLRSRIRHALLVDRLGTIGSRKMTATEVLERSSEMTRLLGATYGRLQTELLTPLLTRAIGILRRRGEIPDVVLDGRLTDLQYKSPLARLQAQQDVHNTLIWLESAARMGAEALAAVDLPATARWLGDRLGVPGQLIRDVEVPTALLELADSLAAPTPGQRREGRR